MKKISGIDCNNCICSGSNAITDATADGWQ